MPGIAPMAEVVMNRSAVGAAKEGAVASSTLMRDWALAARTLRVAAISRSTPPTARAWAMMLRIASTRCAGSAMSDRVHPLRGAGQVGLDVAAGVDLGQRASVHTPGELL